MPEAKERTKWGKGLPLAAAFGVCGFLIGTPMLAGALWVLNFPGWMLLRIFFSDMEIGGGIYWLLMVTNPICYGLVGYLVGLLTRTRRQAFLTAGIVAAAAILVTVVAQAVLPAMERRRGTARLRREALTRLQADPEDVYALHWLGVHAYSRTRDYEEAAARFQRAAEVESKKGAFSIYGQGSLIYLALIYQSWGELDQAETYYDRFIATHPDVEKYSSLRWLDIGYRRNLDEQ